MSQAAEGLKEQLYQHYYALTKNAANYLRSAEKQAEAEQIMKQIEAINASQAPGPAPAVSKREMTLMKYWEAFIATKQNPVFDPEYKKKMLADIQAGYAKENPGVNLETVYQQLLGKSKGGARKKTRHARKTRKNRA